MNKQLHEIFEKHSLPNHKHMRVVARYGVTLKKWTFMGYACSKCEKTVKTEYVAKKHLCMPSLARKCLREEVKENIKTVSGRPFKQLL